MKREKLLVKKWNYHNGLHIWKRSWIMHLNISNALNLNTPKREDFKK